ncbi:uncharacterized protein TNCV_1692741 [Trichonephila clavipes]|nr:uncharacterized protein TNCV_1692741 [Trichonephila clavipes]
MAGLQRYWARTRDTPATSPLPRTLGHRGHSQDQNLQVFDWRLLETAPCESLRGNFSKIYELKDLFWLTNEKFIVLSVLSKCLVAEWYRYRIVACLVTSSSPVPLKTRRVGQRCTLNLSRAESSSRWCGVVVRRGGCQRRCRPRHLTMVQNYVVRSQKPSCS